MKRILLICFIFVIATSLFSLDYYTNRDKKDKAKVNIYSPKKESAKDGWEFIGDKDNINPYRAYWRLKIDAKELPYKYIEKAITDDFTIKNAEVKFSLKDEGDYNFASVISKVSVRVFPRPTGDYYEYSISGRLVVEGKDYGIVSGKAKGKRINNRLNFSIFSEVKNNDIRLGSFSGSLTLGLDNGDFKDGLFTFFARLKIDKRWTYARIRGRIAGNINDARIIKSSIIDVDGRLIGDIDVKFKLD